MVRDTEIDTRTEAQKKSDERHERALQTEATQLARLRVKHLQDLDYLQRRRQEGIRGTEPHSKEIEGKIKRVHDDAEDLDTKQEHYGDQPKEAWSQYLESSVDRHEREAGVKVTLEQAQKESLRDRIGRRLTSTVESMKGLVPKMPDLSTKEIKIPIPKPGFKGISIPIPKPSFRRRPKP